MIREEERRSTGRMVYDMSRTESVEEWRTR